MSKHRIVILAIDKYFVVTDKLRNCLLPIWLSKNPLYRTIHSFKDMWGYQLHKTAAQHAFDKSAFAGLLHNAYVVGYQPVIWQSWKFGE